MQIAKVVGTVVSTKKNETLVGYKLLIVRFLEKNLKTYGGTRIAVDTVGAGVGELVLCVSGAASRNAVGNMGASIDAAIVGIVDTLDISISGSS